MRIIVDAMGGDNAPQEIVLGAIEAAKEFGVEVTLVGRGGDILEAMRENGIDTLPQGVEVAHADDVVDMHDEATDVLRQHKNSSMVQGLKMLADGNGDAFISAGSTGALLTAATLLVRRVRGIRRAAFGPVMPTKTGHCMIIDSGANTECTPEFLMQFGCMGSFYMKRAMGIEKPRVGLLNNGTEETKGTDLQRQAFALLRQAGDDGLIDFVGNVEARDVPLGEVDVIVCEGFSGNVLLKSIEGTGMLMASKIKGIFKKNIWSKLGYLLCRSGVQEVKNMLDYREIGGTMLLGISKPVIKAHGSSDARAIRSAIRQAMLAVQSGITEEIKANVAHMSAPKE